MIGPITNRMPVQAPPAPVPAPPPEVARALPTPGPAGLPNLGTDANAAAAALISAPTSPGMPIGAPSTAKSTPGQTIIALAEKLLGKPLSDQVKQQVSMESGLLAPTQVIQNLLTQPGIAQSLAQRALGLFKDGKISGLMGDYFKSKVPPFIKAASSLFKPGGLKEKLQGLKSAFNVPSLSQIKLGGGLLSKLFAPKPAPQPAAG